MIDGISWVLRTVTTAAEAEMNDDAALREQLLNAEMQREMGEISDEDFASIERDVLARIREINERREGGSGPLAFGEGEPIETTGENTLQIEASVSGDFHDPAAAPHTTVIEQEPSTHGILAAERGQVERVLDMEATSAEPLQQTALPLPPTPPTQRTRTSRRRTIRTTRTTRTTRTSKIR